MQLNQWVRITIGVLLSALVLLEGKSLAAEYRVAAEDILNVTVFDEPDLSVSEARVSSAGTIALPLIGDVPVTGLTTAEIASKLEGLLSDGYLKKPKVSVSIHEYRQVYVHGEVKKPGGYSYQQGLTVEKAVVLAGGFTERASRTKITLVREERPEVTVPVSLDYTVGPGDIITVGESFF